MSKLSSRNRKRITITCMIMCISVITMFFGPFTNLNPYLLDLLQLGGSFVIFIGLRLFLVNFEQFTDDIIL